MTLEQAVRRLTFDSASTFGLYDRGLLRPGMVADIVIFDPDTVKPLPLEVVHDFPTGAKRIKEPAQGIMMTIVNGEVLMEDGKHTGALPGRVLRNTYYQGHARLTPAKPLTLPVAFATGPPSPAMRERVPERSEAGEGATAIGRIAMPTFRPDPRPRHALRGRRLHRPVAPIPRRC